MPSRAQNSRSSRISSFTISGNTLSVMVCSTRSGPSKCSDGDRCDSGTKGSYRIFSSGNGSREASHRGQHRPFRRCRMMHTLQTAKPRIDLAVWAVESDSGRTRVQTFGYSMCVSEIAHAKRAHEVLVQCGRVKLELQAHAPVLVEHAESLTI